MPSGLSDIFSDQGRYLTSAVAARRLAPLTRAAFPRPCCPLRVGVLPRLCHRGVQTVLRYHWPPRDTVWMHRLHRLVQRPCRCACWICPLHQTPSAALKTRPLCPWAAVRIYLSGDPRLYPYIHPVLARLSGPPWACHWNRPLFYVRVVVLRLRIFWVYAARPRLRDGSVLGVDRVCCGLFSHREACGFR